MPATYPVYGTNPRVLPALAAVFAVLVAAVVALVVFASMLWPQNAGEESQVGVGYFGNFEVGQPVLDREHKFWLVKQPDGTFLAFFARSTHLGCFVDWRPDIDPMRFGREGKGVFRDVCYGSAWTTTGERIYGPAPRDLDQFPVRLDGTDVVVDTNPNHLIESKR
ncbi:MAG TPA: Rieske (2Fe-2S) protein [Dehalococcoidia bacterium]|nr:Rieske (2Fe-2S) protein [Dehalococcoidia bacterium]